jgi:hypothetical protein
MDPRLSPLGWQDLRVESWGVGAAPTSSCGMGSTSVETPARRLGLRRGTLAVKDYREIVHF